MNLRVFLAILAVLIFSVNGYAQCQVERGTVSWLEAFQRFITEDIPSGLSSRRQVARELRRISNSLDDLSIEKEELAEALLAFNATSNRGRLQASIERHKEAIQRVRRNIRDFSDHLPGPDREVGLCVARELSNQLGDKWAILDGAQRLMDEGSPPNPIQVRNQVRTAIDLVRRLKQLTDRLITRID